MRTHYQNSAFFYNIKKIITVCSIFKLFFTIIALNLCASLTNAYIDKENCDFKEEKPETVYYWQLPTWPNLHYETSKIQVVLKAYQVEVDRLSKKFNRLSKTQQGAVLRELLTLEGIKILELRKETNCEAVISFLKNEIKDNDLKKYRSVGTAHLIFLINQDFQDPLSKEQLFKYHDMVLTDPEQRNNVDIARWRTHKIVVQYINKRGEKKVVYRGLPHKRVNQEMTNFINWFNKTDPTHGTHKISGLVRAAVAYYYFEDIHPFADGNGRIGRAIVKKALLQELGWPIFSLSNELKTNQNALNTTKKRSLTPWVTWFVNLAYRELLNSKPKVLLILEKAEALDRQQSVWSNGTADRPSLPKEVPIRS